MTDTNVIRFRDAIEFRKEILAIRYAMQTIRANSLAKSDEEKQKDTSHWEVLNKRMKVLEVKYKEQIVRQATILIDNIIECTDEDISEEDDD